MNAIAVKDYIHNKLYFLVQLRRAQSVFEGHKVTYQN